MVSTDALLLRRLRCFRAETSGVADPRLSQASIVILAWGPMWGHITNLSTETVSHSNTRCGGWTWGPSKKTCEIESGLPRVPKRSNPLLLPEKGTASFIHQLSSMGNGERPKGNCYLIMRTDGWLMSYLCMWMQEARPGTLWQCESPTDLSPSSHLVSLFCSSWPSRCRNVGVSWPGPCFAESSLHHDEDRGWKGSPKEKMEVAADATEQGG